MEFCPFILNADGERVPALIEPMTASDAMLTGIEPKWYTSWTSDYLSDTRLEKFAVRVSGELVALVAYEILAQSLVVHIVYMEAEPGSNPVTDCGNPGFTGIGRLLVAYGIKLSIDNGFAGDVILEAKTSELARHYEKDFMAVRLPSFGSGAPRYLIADTAAKWIFFTYLK